MTKHESTNANNAEPAECANKNNKKKCVVPQEILGAENRTGPNKK